MNIGIDVGGMSIKAGAVTPDGEIIARFNVPTPTNDGESFLNSLSNAVDGLLKKINNPGDIEFIGIGAPGIVDREKNIFVSSNNIGYRNAPVGDYLSKKYGVDVIVENDANCAALGEFYFAGNLKNFVFITLGTGIGGGIIINGKLLCGINGAAAEIGHTVIHAGGKRCNCGRQGCWEAYASMKALELSAKERAAEMGLDKQEIVGKTVFDEAARGSIAATELRDNWLREVAIGVTNMVNIFQPEEVIIGGTVSKQGDVLLKPIADYVYENEYTRDEKNIKKTRVSLPRISDNAGIIGASFLKRNREE